VTPAHSRKKPEVHVAPRHGTTRRAPLSADVDDLTGPVEDYLKAIYQRERSGEPAATNDLAIDLGVAPASVTGMVRRLAEQGLLTYERYRGVRLTAHGRLGALRTLRRHRVIEAYLVNALGYRWDEVHGEAERLEHAASNDLIDRMAEAIGEPTVDPHGAPIPSREGAVAEARYRTLSELEPGMAADVMQVEDEDPELLRYLAELAIMPGSTVRMLERAPFGGPITVQIDKRSRQIGPALAERVLVRPRRPRR
jgi:DtxR family transcriptional regulator, Mn-dependent transcriptional regulator